MIYLDSSALVKLVADEHESADLAAWLDAHPTTPVVSSVLGHVETVRAAARLSARAASLAAQVLATVGTVDLTADIARQAQSLAPASLRTLDALHVSSAAALAPGLLAMVAYDRRLLDAAREVGLPTESPGLPGV